MVGEQVLRDRGLAREVVDCGHAVAVHGLRHRNLLRLSPSAIGDDLDRAVSVIADATGVVPVVHRPPYGIYSWPGLHAVRARGWAPLLWSRWGRDWTAHASAESIALRVTRDLAEGDVLLLHD